MEEKVLRNKKKGLLVLVVLFVLYFAAIGAIVAGAALENIPFLLIGIVWSCVGWIPFFGLKVIKPQEALVLTLFGEYVGTLKTEGFYFVNPFCVAVNPAASTKLSQSGDVRSNIAKAAGRTSENVSAPAANK
ncbi:MAG: SPFH domain-containing protein, partial [Lachnospiraceae bacterium]